VPTVTLEGDADGAPHLDPASYAKRFSGRGPVRVDLAPGAAFPKHTHPGEEVIYVFEGTLEYDVEGKPPVTLAK
jgi:quercetin dioxygenase-like cupin family protein